ncbi:MAG: TfoX/Sxy family DNA transformation protein [Pseudomonadota bacterium]
MAGSPVSSIRNLGPRSEEAFAKAGLHTAEEVRALGPDEAYRRLIAAGTRPHFIGFYSLVMGLQGRPWNDLDAKEKVELRHRFDALVASAKDVNALERDLDALGVVVKR